MSLTFVVLAAGSSTRYGLLKQLDPVGPNGAVLMDYAILDAYRAGFSRFVIVIREEYRADFEAHFENQFKGKLDLHLTAQAQSDVPPAYGGLSLRKKPWGTGHAVLAARNTIEGPFSVGNADDFYGAHAYTALADFLSLRGAGGASFAVVGYPIMDTLSDHGGVSRAVLEEGSAKDKTRIVELLEVTERDGSIEGITASGKSHTLNEDSVVSMNLWAFTPAVFGSLQEQFVSFLERHGEDEKAEFLLSDSIDRQVEVGRSTLETLPTTGKWFGMTFEQDKEGVMAKIQRMTESGEYPENLSDAIG